jgi:hypothetical protein
VKTLKPRFFKESRRYRRLYLRQSVKFWLLGALAAVIVASAVLAGKFMFDKVYESRVPHPQAVLKR